MPLDPNAIAELKEILRKKYGRDFEDSEVIEIGANLINLYKLILNINRDDY